MKKKDSFCGKPTVPTPKVIHKLFTGSPGRVIHKISAEFLMIWACSAVVQLVQPWLSWQNLNSNYLLLYRRDASNRFEKSPRLAKPRVERSLVLSSPHWGREPSLFASTVFS